MIVFDALWKEKMGNLLDCDDETLEQFLVLAERLAVAWGKDYKQVAEETAAAVYRMRTNKN